MGTLKVRLRNGCPEVVCQAQAMELVMELERRLLERNTKDLEARLFSLTLEEDKCWTDLLHNHLSTGSREDGLKALFSCPIMTSFEDYDKGDLAVGWNPMEFDLWAAMKRALPLPRRERKRLRSSDQWVVAFTRDKCAKDPMLQADYGNAAILRVDTVMERSPEVLELLTRAVANGRLSAVVSSEDAPTSRSLALQVWLYVMAKVYGCGLLQAGFLTMTTDNEDLALNLAMSLQTMMGMNEVPLGRTTDGKEWIGFTDMSEMRVLEGRTDSSGTPLLPELHQRRLRGALAGILESRLFWPRVSKISTADRLLWANT